MGVHWAADAGEWNGWDGNKMRYKGGNRMGVGRYLRRWVYILNLGFGAVLAEDKDQTQGPGAQWFTESVMVPWDEPATNSLRRGRWPRRQGGSCLPLLTPLCLFSSHIQRCVCSCPSHCGWKSVLLSASLSFWSLYEPQIDAAHILPQRFILCLLSVTKLNSKLLLNLSEGPRHGTLHNWNLKISQKLTVAKIPILFLPNLYASVASK